MKRDRSVTITAAIFLACMGWSTRTFSAPARDTPLWATFGPSGSIQDDGRGAYGDGVDGVRSHINHSSGDFLLRLDLRPASSPRYAVYHLDNPVPGTGAANLGVFWLHDETHSNVPGVGRLAVGETRHDNRASFHIVLNGTVHRLRYGFVSGDGTDPLRVTRTSATTWLIETTNLHRARLWKSTSEGEVPVGDYYLPFRITLEVM